MATGVYRVSGSPSTWRQSVQAGVWALGQDAAISHASAARLYGLDRFETMQRVHVRRSRHQRRQRQRG